MLYAIINGKKTKAQKGLMAICPGCGRDVFAACGEINIHHWRHELKSNCSYFGNETAWHLAWKLLFPEKYTEIVKGDHRADVLLPGGTCVEFQNSSITIDEIQNRNSNYDRIIWVFNLKEQNNRGQIEKRFNHETSKYTIKYLRAKKYIESAGSEIYIDIEPGNVMKLDRIFCEYEFNRKTEYNEWIMNAQGVNMKKVDFVTKIISIDESYK